MVQRSGGRFNSVGVQNGFESGDGYSLHRDISRDVSVFALAQRRVTTLGTVVTRPTTPRHHDYAARRVATDSVAAGRSTRLWTFPVTG